MQLKYLKQFFITGCLLFSALFASAFKGIEPYQHQKQGTIKKGDTLLVKDEKFQNSSFDWEKIHNKSVYDIVTFGLYRDSMAIPKKNFKATIDLKIEYWSSPDQVDPAVDDHIKLTIGFDTTKGASYQANATYRFKNGYKVKLTVNDISSDELGDQLPAAFRLSGQVIVERSYEPDTAHLVPTVVVPSSGRTGAFNAAVMRSAVVSNQQAGIATISWDNLGWPEEYDLEWTFVDEMSDFGRILEAQGTGTPVETLAKMFRNNASRATVDHEYYDISLVHYMKYLLVRVRTAYMDDFKIRQEGDWDYSMTDANGNTTNAVIVLDAGTIHEPTLNWQYSATYSEGGKKKEMVSYFDGSLRNRQVITLNNTDQKVLIQENLYDEFGREQVNILPYAVNSNVLKYYPGQHLTATGSDYTWANVYGSGGDCISTPQAMGTGAGAGKYYSQYNEFLSDMTRPESHFLPDAEGYPFSVSLYTPDNTNRVAVKGGVGALFQPGPDNTVSKANYMYYSKPAQWELDRMFGNDAGYANHYQKKMLVDGNGQVSITYENLEGKTVATALAGGTPDNLDALPTKPDPRQETFYLIEPRDFIFDDSKLLLSASSTYAAAVPGPVSFTYNVEKLIKIYEDKGVKICSNCYYDLRIRIADNCNKVFYDQTVPVGSLTGDCNATGTATGTIDTRFEKIGEYFVSYELGLSSSVLDAYTNDFILKNTNLNTKWSYINTALQAKDMASCFDDCVSCLASLGTQEAFTTAVKNRLNADGVELTATIDTWANNLYTSLYNNCVALRANCTSDPCTELENVMKADVSPGGQYALFSEAYEPLEESANVIALYWRTVFRTQVAGQADYEANKFELKDGTVMSANDVNCTLAMLIDNWQPKWADLFVSYHPEYCALKFCHANSANLQWDQKVANITTIADIPGVLNGATWPGTDLTWLVNQDPAFNGLLSGFKVEFTNLLNNYSKNVLGISNAPAKSLMAYVDYLLYCADNTGNTNVNNNPAAGSDNWSACVPVEACRVRDQEWRLCRDKYMELKEKYYASIRNTNTYCGGQCVVGDTLSYATSTTCPELSAFKMQAGESTCGTGLQSVKITYSGAPLANAVTLSLYYPSDYDGLTRDNTANFAAGQTEASICMANEINRTSVLVKGISCRPANDDDPAEVFTCEKAVLPANFSFVITKDATSVDPQTGLADYNCTMYYSGPTIPEGATVYIDATTQFQPEPYLDVRRYTFNPGVKVITVKMTAKKELTGQISSGAGCTYTPPAVTPPTCPAGLKYKISRVNNVSYSTSGISNDPQVLSNQVAATLAQSIKENCEAQAEIWMTQLDACIAGEPDYEATKTKIRARLIEVCKQGGDAQHPNGASTTPDDKPTSEGFTSFKDVIKASLQTQTLSMICNPYLLDAPFPYNVKVQATAKVISKTDADICAKLATLQSAYNSSGSGAGFYQYLVNTFGSGMTLTQAELTSLQKGCDNCRYLLASDLKLPVFLEPGAKGCITAQEFRAGLDKMNSEANWISSAGSGDYERTYANFLNQLWGFSLSFSQYYDYVMKVDADPNTTALLCNTPVYTAVKVNPYSCTEEMIDDAVATGTVLYNEYIAEEKRKFRKEYIAYCSAVKPNLQITTNEQLYHFTLFYYDQAGNLVRTVPPEGVHLLDAGLQTQVDLVREYKGASCTFDGPVTESQKDSALTAITEAFSATTARSLELWLYNANGGGQFLATGSGQQYMVNACISGRYLNLDVYTMSPGNGLVDVIASVHTVADMQAALPLKPWTHVVFQGALLNANNLSVYVDGKLCPVTTANIEPGNCGWVLQNGIYPENFAAVKQIRIFSRLLSAGEIAANAAEPCMSFAGDYATGLNNAKLYRGRFNVPAAESATTTGAGSLSETQFSPVYPAHTLASSFAYQSLNSESRRSTPDAGLMQSWFDRAGRVIASQNAVQLDNSKFSYSRFDAQNRLIEIGEKSPSTVPSTARFWDSGNTNTFYSTGVNKQITNSYYDAAYSGFAYTQHNLRKRISAVTYRDNAGDAPQQATYYDYDQAGNVKTQWQQIQDLGLKKIEFNYDLISNKVNKIRYQYDESDSKPDQFMYGYEYDADNRVERVKSGLYNTSYDEWAIENPKTDAHYIYYLNGAMARMELGNDLLVQGVDYAYTLQGWLKMVNSQFLSPAKDMGSDGLTGNDRSVVAPDVYGYSLEYFKGDYKAVDADKTPGLKWLNGGVGEIGADLFDGSIARSTMALGGLNNTVGYSYRYNQLSWLKSSRQHSLAEGAVDWSAATAGQKYLEDITYDANGNILSYLRNGSGVSPKALAMDNLTYKYARDAAGNLLNNKLQQVINAVTTNDYEGNLKSQDPNNYTYDKIGNLIKNTKEGIDNIEWNLSGKIKSITKTGNNKLEYRYDAMGNRVYKAYTHDGVTEKTWYVYGARGNVLAVYGNKNGDGNIYWKEQQLYGDKRLGVWKPDMLMTAGNAGALWDMAGLKRYELTNHLGNVMAIVGDNLDSDNKAYVYSTQDYYPFGMVQPDRSVVSDNYRYAFNGQEKSDELVGHGNSYTAEFWEYDPRIGKRWNVDPRPDVGMSAYQAFRNNPVRYSDVKGDTPVVLFWSGLFPKYAVYRNNDFYYWGSNKKIDMSGENSGLAAGTLVAFRFFDALPPGELKNRWETLKKSPRTQLISYRKPPFTNQNYNYADKHKRFDNHIKADSYTGFDPFDWTILGKDNERRNPIFGLVHELLGHGYVVDQGIESKDGYTKDSQVELNEELAVEIENMLRGLTGQPLRYYYGEGLGKPINENNWLLERPFPNPNIKLPMLLPPSVLINNNIKQ